MAPHLFQLVDQTLLQLGIKMEKAAKLESIIKSPLMKFTIEKNQLNKLKTKEFFPVPLKMPTLWKISPRTQTNSGCRHFVKCSHVVPWETHHDKWNPFNIISMGDFNKLHSIKVFNFDHQFHLRIKAIYFKEHLKESCCLNFFFFLLNSNCSKINQKKKRQILSPLLCFSKYKTWQKKIYQVFVKSLRLLQ